MDKYVIVVDEGLITINDSICVPLDYEAYSINGMVGIRHVNQKDLELIKGRVLPSQITLNGYTYDDDDDEAEDFVWDFNAVTEPGVAYMLAGMKADVDYPDTMISTILTPNTATPITAQSRPGYVTLYAPEANTGLIHVGTAAVGTGSAAIEAGKSYPVELDNLATVYVLNTVNGEKVHVLGAYKS
jgi:hypothetical protein